MYIGDAICIQEVLYVNRRSYNMYTGGHLGSKVKIDAVNSSASEIIHSIFAIIMYTHPI